VCFRRWCFAHEVKHFETTGSAGTPVKNSTSRRFEDTLYSDTNIRRYEDTTQYACRHLRESEANPYGERHFTETETKITFVSVLARHQNFDPYGNTKIPTRITKTMSLHQQQYYDTTVKKTKERVASSTTVLLCYSKKSCHLPKHDATNNDESSHSHQ
jgi:hypothetical protein